MGMRAKKNLNKLFFKYYSICILENLNISLQVNQIFWHQKPKNYPKSPKNSIYWWLTGGLNQPIYHKMKSAILYTTPTPQIIEASFLQRTK
jgi:hypothetical protein